MSDSLDPAEIVNIHGSTTWPTPAKSWYSLSILIITVIFGFVNKQVIVMLVEPIKFDLDLSDTNIGIIVGLGPAILAALIGYPLACLADRRSRRNLLIGSVLFWSIATALCGAAKDFSDLLVASIGIAIGEAALIPIVYSLIPDLFPVSSRDKANFVFLGVTIVGGGLGLILGGAAVGIIEHMQSSSFVALGEFATWRLVFFFVACPGIILTLLIIPVPDNRVTQVAPSGSGLQDNKGLTSFVQGNRATTVLIFCASGFYSFALGGFSAWLAPAAMRQMGTAASSAGIFFGIAFSVGAMAGIAVAMSTVRFWERLAGIGYPVRALKYAMMLSPAPLICLLFVGTDIEVFLVAGFLYLIVVAGSAYSPAMYQNMAPHDLRARIIAFGTIIFASMGAVGPLAIGVLSDLNLAEGFTLIQVIVFVSVPSFFISGILFHFAEESFVKTVKSIQVELP
jgi:MFS family permease